MDRPGDPDARHVPAQLRGQLRYLADVQHDVDGQQVRRRSLPVAAGRPAQDENGHRDAQALPHPPLARMDTGQPGGPQQRTAYGLPRRIKIPFAMVRAVQALGIPRRKRQRKCHRRVAPGDYPANGINDGLRGRGHPGTKIWAVENKGIDTFAVVTIGRPQRNGQAAGRMPAQQDPLVAFPLNDIDCGIDFGIVFL